ALHGKSRSLRRGFPGATAPGNQRIQRRELEEQLECELNLTTRIRGANRPESCVGSSGVRNAQVSVLQEVKELRAELQPEAFANRERLVRGEVPLHEVRRAESVAAEVAEGCACRRRCERVAGEVAVDRRRLALVEGAAADVGPLEGL